MSAVLDKLREICLALPNTEEKITWDHPNFRVANKIFCSYQGYDHDPVISFKVDKNLQSVFVADPRFTIAPYVGRHGWVCYNINAGPVNWEEITPLIEESYRLIAPGKKRK